MWLRTSDSDALTLRRGERVDAAFTAWLDPAATTTPTPPDGHFLLVAFGYTSCPDICPATLTAVHLALERLGAGAGHLVPIFVTVDPVRDTADRLRQYLASFDSRIRSISDPAVVATTLREFHARAEARRFPSGNGYSIDHTAVLYVLDPERRVIAALPEATATLASDLVGALSSNPAFRQ